MQIKINYSLLKRRFVGVKMETPQNETAFVNAKNVTSTHTWAIGAKKIILGI